MDIRDSVVSGLEKLRETVYRGPVRGFSRAVGVERALKRFYSSVLSSVSDEDTVTHEVSGVEAEFLVSTGMEVQRFRSLMDEAGVVESLMSDVGDEDVFYDVGANVGLYTCFVSQKSGETVAFEPHPENLKRLRENVNLNGLKNVTPHSYALSDEDGMTELAVRGADVAGEGTHSLATGGEDRTVKVETAKVDTLVRDGTCPAPDVMKIDVEGAELSVLKGMKDTLRGCSVVYCEVHPDKLPKQGGTVEEVRSILDDAGFEVEELEERGFEEFLRAEKN